MYRTSMTLKSSLIKTHKKVSIIPELFYALLWPYSSMIHKLLGTKNATTLYSPPTLRSNNTAVDDDGDEEEISDVVLLPSFFASPPYSGTLNGASSPQLSTTGFELASGATRSVDVPSLWSGQFWARTGCSSDFRKFACASGQVSCNGAGAIPTLIELTVAANGGQDFYDDVIVSNVDGFNLPVSMAPQGGTGDCKVSSCPANINTRNAHPPNTPNDDKTSSTFTCFSNPNYVITLCHY
ncbi:hypothetical protein K1719_031734 [Acacia pycnantha]|nr:hypothetical protein K1719_031734 [Acacia pycnantha]